jgi:hypothetical protein
MPINRRRALGLLTVVLGACASGDNDGVLTSGYSGGTTDGNTNGTTGMDTDGGTETDTYGTDGTDGGYGDGGYFDEERSAEDIDLGE